MEMDPEFHPDHGVTPSADEQKRRVARKLARFHHQNLLPDNINQLKYRQKVNLALFCFYLNILIFLYNFHFS